METIVVNGTPRTELGKKATRALRKAGNVPCNLYGGKETLNFYAPASAFKKLIFTPDFRVAEITVDGKSYKAIVKDSQYEPVKGALMHLDFQELQDDVQVKVSIPLRLKGTAKGITDGGKLEQRERRLWLLALPKDIPSVIELDITSMGVGEVRRVRDLQVPNVTFLLSPANPIVSVLIPRQVTEEVAAPTAAAEGAAPAAGATPAAPAKEADKKDDKKK